MSRGTITTDSLLPQSQIKPSDDYVLRLYVAGNSPNSLRAKANLLAICNELLPGRYRIDIVDALQDPLRLLEDGIWVTPLLMKIAPLPTAQIIGDLSDRRQVLMSLGIGAP